MKKWILAIIISIFAICSNSFNPGTIIGIREPILNQARDKYFSLLMLGFQFLSFDNVESGLVTLGGITGSLTNTKPENVKIGFDVAQNALTLDITKSTLKLHSNWRADSKTGVADVSGILSHVVLYLSFSTKGIDDDELIPQISIKDVVITSREEDFKFSYSCDQCSEALIQNLNTALKTNLFQQIKNEAKAI